MDGNEVCIIIKDNIGTAQTRIKTGLSAPQFMDELLGLRDDNQFLKLRVRQLEKFLGIWVSEDELDKRIRELEK